MSSKKREGKFFIDKGYLQKIHKIPYIKAKYLILNLWYHGWNEDDHSVNSVQLISIVVLELQTVAAQQEKEGSYKFGDKKVNIRSMME